MDQEKRKEALEILDKIFHVAKGAEITYIENQVSNVCEIINSTQEVEFEETWEEFKTSEIYKKSKYQEEILDNYIKWLEFNYNAPTRK